MTTASTRTADCATKSSGTLCMNIAASVQLTTDLSDKARAVFAKPYRALVDLLNISERDAHYRLRGARKYTALEVSRLLQSEEGIQFLVVLMGKARPRWWNAVLEMGVLGSVKKRREADLQLMRKVFHADKDTAATFSDSFRAQDPDFFGAVLAGYDELAPISGVDSSLAKGGRR